MISPLTAAEIARDTYRDEIDSFHSVNRRGTQCFMGIVEESGVIAFRGSDEASDWLKNVSFRKHRNPYGPGKAHLGFLRGLESVWDTIYPFVASVESDEIHLVGHSYGAAIATVAASAIGYMLRGSGPRVYLHTFGSPRVGNRTFAKFVEQKCIPLRYVNCNDIVCRVPKVLYWHVGLPWYFDRSGYLYFNPSVWCMLFDRIQAKLKDTKRAGLHDIEVYRSLIAYEEGRIGAAKA